MGGHYGSIQIRSENRQLVTAVAERVAKAKQIHILVAPPLNGWIALFPEGNGQDDAVGHAVAEQLDEDVLQLIVHDDDILAYWYYRGRRLVDSYWSCPGYFGEENRQKEEAMSGNPESFKYLVGEKDLPKLAELLDRDSDFFTFEYERLEKLGKLLKISNAVHAFEYLKLGERKGIKDWREFVEVPAERVLSEAKQRQQKKRDLAAERKRLKDEGLLLQDDHRPDVMPHGCAVADGFLVAWPDYRWGTVSFNWYSNPLDGPAAIELGTPKHLAGIESDASGHRIAFTAGHHVSVWDFRGGEWVHICDVPEEDHSVAVAVSADRNLLAHASRREIVINQIDPRQTVLRSPTGRTSGALAFHPSKQWLAVSGNSLGLIALNESEPWREIYVGGKADPPPFQEATLTQLRNLNIDEIAKKEAAKADKVIEYINRRSETPLTNEQIQTMKRQMAEEWEQRKTELLKIRECGLPPKPAIGREQVRSVGFSRDGQWVWCGTQLGVRIYEWDLVPRNDRSDMPKPKWRFDPPHDSSSFFGPQVNAIAEDVEGNAIVFGGSGRLYRLDLTTGDVKELVLMPQHAAITGLAFSKDGRTLGIATHTIESIQPAARRDQKFGWSIWSYEKLLANTL